MPPMPHRSPHPSAPFAPLLAFAAGTLFSASSAAQVPSHPGPTRLSTPGVDGFWEGPYAWPLPAIHSAMLPTGDVIQYSYDLSGPGATVWVFDPEAYTLYNADHPEPLFCSGHALLPDGRLLVAGGTAFVDPVTGTPHGLLDTNLFDGLFGSWTSAPDMARGRFYPTVITLSDGRTVALSGIDESGNPTLEVETFSSPAGWSILPGADQALELYPRPHLLSSGRVAVVGPQQTTLVLDPSTSGWSTVASTLFGARFESCSFLYPGAPDVVVACGGSADGLNGTETCELLDFNDLTSGWQALPSMKHARLHHNAVVLPSGQVLAVGGNSFEDPGAAVMPAEIFDPSTALWRDVAPVAKARVYHSSTALFLDGRVIVGGGDGELTVEIYWPPYMFKPRPAITGAPLAADYGDSFLVTLPAGQAGAIARVALLKLAATTHSVAMDQRFVELAFSQFNGTSLQVFAPAHGAVAPPGHYMLVVIDGKNMPSVARVLRIGS